jgi:cobalt-zinc-cadmium efflux system protein
VNDRKRLSAVLVLTVLYMALELVGGLWTGSLALLADAGHMLTDVASLALALGALWFARRPPTTRHTYGFYRVEILAALVNGVALWAIVIWIFIEAFERLRSPAPILAGPMMAIAAGGLLVNGAAFWILHRRHDPAVQRSLNVHGALLHVVGDFLGSAGALAAGAAVAFLGWRLADPLVSLMIGALIVVASWRLVRDATHILLEGAPMGLDVGTMIDRVLAVRGVAGIHDLHVWTLTSGYAALSAHVVCGHAEEREMLLARVNRVLREEFGITHTTIQLEPKSPPGHSEPMTYPISTVE